MDAAGGDMTLGKDSTELADLRQKLAWVRAVLADVGRAIERVEGHQPTSPGAVHEPDWVSEWGTVAEAQRIRQCSHETMVHHIRRHGLGVKVDGRWRVDLNRVRAWNEGRQFPHLDDFRGPFEVSPGSDSPPASGE